jgi:hypothetical protein
MQYGCSWFQIRQQVIAAIMPWRDLAVTYTNMQSAALIAVQLNELIMPESAQKHRKMN